jgi:hypothetical protein
LVNVFDERELKLLIGGYVQVNREVSVNWS